MRRVGLVVALLLICEWVVAANWAETTASSLRVRLSPGGEVIAGLPVDTRVEQLGEQDGWAYIRFLDPGSKIERSGWVSADYLRPIQAHVSQRAQSTTNDGTEWTVPILFVGLVIAVYVEVSRRNPPRRIKPLPLEPLPARRSVVTTDSTVSASTNEQVSPALSTEDSEPTEEFLRRVRVKHVIDGDTVVVATFWHQFKVRLEAIDCPEDGQPWSDIATAGLIKLIGGKHVYLEGQQTDVHGRVIATLFVYREGELMNVNERMVMLGHAWVMRRFYEHLPKERQAKLNQLERWAKTKRVGLWQAENPVPPWHWRNGTGKAVGD